METLLELPGLKFLDFDLVQNCFGQGVFVFDVLWWMIVCIKKPVGNILLSANKADESLCIFCPLNVSANRPIVN